MDIRDIDFEEVEAEAAYKNKYGLHVKRVKALGCTSRGQARRFAKAILFAEQRECNIFHLYGSRNCCTPWNDYQYC